MDFLRVGCILGSVIGGCVAQVENYCPSSPVPTNTSHQNLSYVYSEIENKWCFYDPSDAAGGPPCHVGYHCSLVGRPCFPCPYDENGIKTYQPKKNSCSKCILCRDCEKEGMEEVFRCTRENNAVCQKRSFQPTDKYYSTTEAEEEDTHPFSSTPSSPVTEKIPLQDEMAETGDTDEDNLELEKLRKQITLLHWIVGITVSLLVICLAGYASYKLIKYKLRKHSTSSSTGDEQDRNQNSGHSTDPGEEQRSSVETDGQDRNQNSGHSRDSGEESTLMSGEEQRSSVETDEQNRNQNSGHSRDPGEESTLMSGEEQRSSVETDEQNRNQNSGHSRDPGEESTLMSGEEQCPSVETDGGMPLEDMNQTTGPTTNDGEDYEDAAL